MTLSLRLRRSLSLSFILNHFTSSFSSTSPLFYSKPHSILTSNPSLNPKFPIQSHSFKSSSILSNYRGGDDTESKIGPDDILFEGCDYNHWLITIDFPKNPAPTEEEMVETYVQTAAQVFGSVEEAKKRMYACSTTTYQGFQVLCDEATSEKFRGLPGVVFILPDSYIDPVNKEYGGDKYENGIITRRPPPVQYFRGGRDRNRNNDQQRYTPRDELPRGRGFAPPGPGFRAPPQQGGGGYRGPPPQGGGGYGGPPPPPPQGGYGAPPQQGGGGYGAPLQQGGGGYGAPQQQGAGGYGAPQQGGGGYGAPPQGRGGYGGPPPQGGGGYGAPQQGGGGYGAGPQDGRGNYGQASGFNQGQQGNYVQREQSNFSQRMGGDYMQPSPGNSAPPPTQGSQRNDGSSSIGSD